MPIHGVKCSQGLGVGDSASALIIRFVDLAPSVNSRYGRYVGIHMTRMQEIVLFGWMRGLIFA